MIWIKKGSTVQNEIKTSVLQNGIWTQFVKQGKDTSYPGCSFVSSTFVNVTCKSKVPHHGNEFFPQQNVPAGQVTMNALQVEGTGPLSKMSTSLRQRVNLSEMTNKRDCRLRLLILTSCYYATVSNSSLSKSNCKSTWWNFVENAVSTVFKKWSESVFWDKALLITTILWPPHNMLFSSSQGMLKSTHQAARKLSATTAARLFERTKMAFAVWETALGFLAPSSLVCWQKTYKNINPSQMLGTGLRCCLFV